MQDGPDGCMRADGTKALLAHEERSATIDSPNCDTTPLEQGDIVRLVRNHPEHSDEILAILDLRNMVQHTAETRGLHRSIDDYLGRIHTSESDEPDASKAIDILKQGLPLVPKDCDLQTKGLGILGNCYDRRFRSSAELEDINQAINYKYQAMLLTRDGQREKFAWLNNLGMSYHIRFECLGKPADIDKAIDYTKQAMHLAPEEDEHPLPGLGNLPFLYLRRFSRLGELADLESAIGYQGQVVSRTAAKDREQQLTKLGDLHMRRFQRLGELTDVDKAIECRSQGVSLTSDQRPGKKSDMLSSLCSLHSTRFSLLGEMVDVNQAVKYSEQALSLAPSEDQTSKLDTLVKLYRSRFNRTDKLVDLDRAIKYQSQLVLIIPDTQVDKSPKLDELANLHMRRFMRLDELADVDRAIDCQSRAVSLAPSGKTQDSVRLAQLGLIHYYRFERLGDLADNSTAIEYIDRALAITPHGHANRLQWLDNLGLAHRGRFLRLGLLANINKAIDCHHQVLSLAPSGHAHAPQWLSNEGVDYQYRFGRTGDFEDINKSIEYLTRSKDLIPDADTFKAVVLSNLGTSYMRRFEHTGDSADNDHSIDYHHQAVALPEGRQVDRAAQLNNLGIGYQIRFKSRHNILDIDSAIKYQVEAVSLTADGHARKHTHLSNLGNSYGIRFDRLGDIEDLDKAIECQAQAVLSSPEEHSLKPVYLTSLAEFWATRFEILDHPLKHIFLHNCGLSLQGRFKHQGVLEDIESSIDYLSQALSLIPGDHANKPGCLNNLGNSYGCRFKCLGQPADIEMAIQCLSQAVSLVPEEHADAVRFHFNLGSRYAARARYTSDRVDAEKAINCFRKSAESPIGDVLTRFEASISWAQSAIMFAAPPLNAYKQAMVYVPQIVWLGTTISHRYKDIEKIGDLVTAAASAAIQLHELDMALEWLEEGRSIVWKQMLQLRTPLEDLSAVDPVLSKELIRVSGELDRAGITNHSQITQPIGGPPREQATQQHHRLASEWDKLLEGARKLPGLDNFLRPKKALELTRAAHSGSVVIVNVHTASCDALALLLDSTTVVHVPLTAFSYKKSVEARALFLSSLKLAGVRTRTSRRPIFHDPKVQSHFEPVLATLWDDIVKPILDCLGYLRPRSGNDLPHLTWCTTGPLAFLPLHAAGRYDKAGEKVFDYVISSYTPTLSSLLGPKPIPTEFSGILTVGQADTFGCVPLPGTIAELDEIRALSGKRHTTQLDGELATSESVLSAMEQHSWVHFACHASQDQFDPTKSAFHLHGSQLDLATIARKSLKHADFAFLSACETAMGDEKVRDEAAHLAAGMIMAGYPTVVATMWSIHDEDAPLVAAKVYGCLFEEAIPDARKTAKALHSAVGSLRDAVGVKSFERWVPYIHMGL